jgi:hypothetical protein
VTKSDNGYHLNSEPQFLKGDFRTPLLKYGSTNISCKMNVLGIIQGGDTAPDLAEVLALDARLAVDKDGNTVPGQYVVESPDGTWKVSFYAESLKGVPADKLAISKYSQKTGMYWLIEAKTGGVVGS